MGRKKKSHELSEDRNIRLVNIHYHRFARFLRYLRDNDAVITVKEKRESRPPTEFIFTSPSRDGNPSINDLIAHVLDLDDTSIHDLLSRKIAVDDKHSDGDRVPIEPGKVIEGLLFNTTTLHKQYDTDIHNLGRIFSARRGRAFSRKQYESFVSLDEMLPHYSNKTHFAILNKLPLLISKHITLLLKTQESFLELYLVESFPFYKQLKELLTTDIEPDVWLLLENIGDYYQTYYNKDETDKSILPGYWDFLLLFNREEVKNATGESLLLEQLQRFDFNLENWVKYRYELLWELVEKNVPLASWSAESKALLILAVLEFRAGHSVATRAAETVYLDLNFIILASNGTRKYNFQQISVTTKELAYILPKYHFKNGLKNTIKVQGNNILTDSITKYPESEAIPTTYSDFDIVYEIEDKIERYYFNQVREALHIGNEVSYNTYASHFDVNWQLHKL